MANSPSKLKSADWDESDEATETHSNGALIATMDDDSESSDADSFYATVPSSPITPKADESCIHLPTEPWNELCNLFNDLHRATSCRRQIANLTKYVNDQRDLLEEQNITIALKDCEIRDIMKHCSEKIDSWERSVKENMAILESLVQNYQSQMELVPLIEEPKEPPIDEKASSSHNHDEHLLQRIDELSSKVDAYASKEEIFEEKLEAMEQELKSTKEELSSTKQKLEAANHKLDTRVTSINTASTPTSSSNGSGTRKSLSPPSPLSPLSPISPHDPNQVNHAGVGKGSQASKSPRSPQFGMVNNAKLEALGNGISRLSNSVSAHSSHLAHIDRAFQAMQVQVNEDKVLREETKRMLGFDVVNSIITIRGSIHALGNDVQALQGQVNGYSQFVERLSADVVDLATKQFELEASSWAQDSSL